MIVLNGEEKDFAGKNISECLKEMGFDEKKVVVEKNLEIISKDMYSKIFIQDGDVIEVLTFVGGG